MQLCKHCSKNSVALSWDVVSSPSASSASALHFYLIAPLPPSGLSLTRPSRSSLAVGRGSIPPI